MSGPSLSTTQTMIVFFTVATPIQETKGLGILPSRLAVRNGESYVAACEAGYGIVQVPRYHVARQLEKGTLIELLAQYRPQDLPMTALYPHHRHLTPRLRVFIDWLAELFLVRL